MTISEPQEFLSGKLSQVDVGRIEKELRALWQQGPTEGEGTQATVVRAVSFTLILFSHDQTRESELSDILDDLMASHPCRAILTFFKDEKPQALDAFVSARCHLLGDKRHVCSEQITVYANSTHPKQFVSVVSPLVLADLPVVLWWRSRDLATPVLEELRKCARKIIVDSGYEPFNTSILQQAADLVIANADKIWLADLNWRRLNGWRRSLAEAFDGFPMPADYLKKIKRVRIHVRGDKKTSALSTQALLLTGWMASRLGWHLERTEASEQRVDFKTDEGSFHVDYESSQDNTAAAAGAIDRVVIKFTDGRQLEIALERNGDSFMLTSQEREMGSKECNRVDQNFSESILVGQELELLSRDRIFEQSLLVAGEITRLIK